MNTTNLFPKSNILNLRNELYTLDTPKVMGILNITKDSFYDGGKYTTEIEQLKQVEQMISNGADFIDIGAQSTRPGSNEVGVNNELELLIPAIKSIRKHFPEVFLSVDTWHSKVAMESYNTGVDMINDISGGLFDTEMFPIISKINIPYIIMHTGDKPDVMQQNPHYNDVVMDVIKFLSKQLSLLNAAGVNDIIVDPGFGFGKNIEHNYSLLNSLKAFAFLETPLLVGISRKSMLYKPLGISAKEALNATTAANMVALQNGADILRVHDVKEAKECIEIYKLTKKY